LERLATNLARLRLTAEVVADDAATWSPARAYDTVVLDAPCTATGSMRRHPDILRLKASADVHRMAQVQRALLDNAARLARPGGTLVYATCSLEPEEGERRSRLPRARSRLFAPPHRVSRSAAMPPGSRATAICERSLSTCRRALPRCPDRPPNHCPNHSQAWTASTLRGCGGTREPVHNPSTALIAPCLGADQSAG
jgi:16S rRNA C967 or C1407 C5-methylase (RsmB/RsmF family)